jgi:glutathione S-transferase
MAAEDYARWYVARLRLLDNALEDGREFLVGGRFTIADICVGYALYVAQAFDLKLFDAPLTDRYTPQTKAYLERLMERPAFQKCLTIQNASYDEFTKMHVLPCVIDVR